MSVIVPHYSAWPLFCMKTRLSAQNNKNLDDFSVAIDLIYVVISRKVLYVKGNLMAVLSGIHIMSIYRIKPVSFCCHGYKFTMVARKTQH